MSVNAPARVCLRAAVQEDRPFLFDLFACTMKGVIQQTWGWDERWQRANFQRRFEGCVVSVIEFEGHPIGGLFVEDREADTYIHEIQILPEYQGRGIGTAVIRGVIDQAASRGAAVGLSVVPVNRRARRLYERLGFEVVSIEDPFIRMRLAARRSS